MNEPPSRRQLLGTVAGGALAVFAIDDASQSAAASSPAPAQTYVPPAPRTWLSLDSGWRFHKGDVAGAQAPGFDDAAWTALSVPHTWNAADGADGGGNYYRGVGWYRRHITVPANLSGKMLFLQFAGANQVADVWIDGTHLGQHQGGYSRFRFGATAALTPGRQSVLAVKVTNAYNPDIAPLSADYTFQGGIYRNVSLYAIDKLGIRMLDYAGPGIYLRQRSVTASSAKVDVTAKVYNNDSTSRSVVVRAVVADAAGTIVADRSSAPQRIGAASGVDVVQTLTIASPRRWNGLADPHLYSATVEIRDAATGTVTDAVTEPLGLRSFSLNTKTGFYLNGSRLGLHGVNLHQDRAIEGWAVSDADHAQDFALIKEIGATTVRMAHYQHDQKDYDLADSTGVVVWAEVPLVNATTDSAAFTTSTENQLRELIRQNYNHPSIVFWSIGNEQGSDDTAANNLLASLAALVRSEDPDRISTYANDLGDDAKVAGHADTTGFNKYYGWYGGSYNDLGPWADSLHKSEPNRTFALSEYGAGANTTQHALNPAKPSAGGQFHPEEYQALVHEASWTQLAARPFVWGTYVWTMFDFASDSRNEGGQPGINDKGLVTRDRATRKDAFYWYKANWATAPSLYITSRRWTSRTDATTEVKVYSNASSVTVVLNGVSLGRQSSSNRVFRWTGVKLRPGANTITASASIAGTTYTDTVTWTLT
ncbi:Beta-galactosidase [Catenulispora acidiphila DSM 44928]|uniref:Beta-galactosidase n=1 Tax=Catenulispora acidiphila (strain DSM 44928 / JCM 14897 / NBRC 102108 / NRRL B-24433 / ID139908) TaxID=479433 RepID=C7Q3E2_CATAD|nr:glycoside hydrolase family 2 TIM barrel-domain containing protein [Catenulispora acidiphila]ACU75707.1 Beta-galactosidase [Catenulispora acidiphila DSM 44928]